MRPSPKSPDVGYYATTVSEHRGIDRSSNNGLVTDPVAWKQAHDFLQNQGGGAQPFVIEKIGEGTGYANPDAHPEIVAAKAAGFAVAGYGFAHLDKDTPAAEVSFWRRIDQDALPIEEDWEVGGTGTVGAAMTELSDLGGQSLLYGNQTYMAVARQRGVPIGRVGWLAEYDGHATPNLPCIIYQNTDALVVPGLGSCDGNRFLGSDADFAHLFANVEQVATTPAAVFTTIDSSEVINMQRVTVTIPLDPSGDGWEELNGSSPAAPAVSYAKMLSCEAEGSFPPVDGYWRHEAKCQDRGGFACVSVTGGPPRGQANVTLVTAD